MFAWSINKRIRTPLLIIAIVESLILFSAVYVAGLVVFGTIEDCQQVLGPLAPRAVIVSVIVLASLVAVGLYQFHHRLNLREAVVRIMVGLVFGCSVVAFVFYVVPEIRLSGTIAAIAVAYTLTLLIFVRFVFIRTMDQNVFRRRTLFYGAGKRAVSLFDLRRRADRRGFRIVGRVAAPGDTLDDSDDLIDASGKSITEVAIENNADEIVVAMDDRRGNLPIRDLLDAKLKGIDVIDLLEFLERETGKIRIDLVNPGWLIFSTGFRLSRFRKFSKRALDIVFGTLAMAVTWPLMILASVAIKLEDGLRAPIIYRQCRVGEGGEHFNLLKFRSMAEDAEADGKAVWAAKDDDRITRVGKFLRSSRLDELPQIFNVLGGSMSLVGPRPERPEFVTDLTEQIPYYAERHVVKPGLTGWAQLKYPYGASLDDAIEKLQYDLYYIKNQTLVLDLLVLLQTVEVVFFSKGAR